MSAAVAREVFVRKWSTSALRRALFTFALLFLPLQPGCKSSPPPAPPALTDSAERGPIRFSVEVTPKEPWIADPITVTLRAATPEDVLVRFPDAKALGAWNVRSAAPAESRPDATGGLAWSQTLIVDTFSAGEKEIPPLVMAYGRKGADGAVAYDSELALGRLKIAVRSALTSQDSLTSPRDITPPRNADREPLRPWQIAFAFCAAGLALALLLSCAATLRGQLRRRGPLISPEEWALRALDDLSRYEWAMHGGHRDVYYRMSEIVRGYVESKFGLRAPEMTTEEFLSTLARDRGALPYDADRLGKFLAACDMVKYAALAPTREDAADAISTARAFVHATAAAAEEHARRRAAELESAERRAAMLWSNQAEGTAAPPLPFRAHDDAGGGDDQRWQGPRSTADGGQAA